jgi:hypothetical protein
MTTPRKARPRKAAPEPEEIDDDDDNELIDDAEPASKAKLYGCLAAVVLAFGFLAMLTVISVLAWMLYQGNTPAPAPPAPAPVAGDFVDADALARVMVGEKAKEHAIYFSKLCSGVAGRLEIDLASSSPIIDQRSEAAALFGIVGDFATMPEGTQYKGLDKVIESTGVAVFGEELAGGELSKDDQKNLVTAWQELSAAFLVVAQ